MTPNRRKICQTAYLALPRRYPCATAIGRAFFIFRSKFHRLVQPRSSNEWQSVLTDRLFRKHAISDASKGISELRHQAGRHCRTLANPRQIHADQICEFVSRYCATALPQHTYAHAQNKHTYSFSLTNSLHVSIWLFIGSKVAARANCCQVRTWRSLWRYRRATCYRASVALLRGRPTSSVQKFLYRFVGDLFCV